MNISQYVTQDKSNSGEWFPVALYGKPVDFDLLILGDDSDAVQKYNRQVMRKLKGLLPKDGEAELDDKTFDEIAKSNDEAVIVRIAGIRGWAVERDSSEETGRTAVSSITITDTATGAEREIKNDAESYRYLISKIPALKEFVLKIAKDRANFLSGPSGN